MDRRPTLETSPSQPHDQGVRAAGALAHSREEEDGVMLGGSGEDGNIMEYGERQQENGVRGSPARCF